MKDLEQQIAELVAERVRAEMEKRPPDSGGFVSLERAAERLDVSVRFLRKQIADGKLAAYKVGACVRVRIADVDALAVRVARSAADEVRERVLKLARGGRP